MQLQRQGQGQHQSQSHSQLQLREELKGKEKGKENCLQSQLDHGTAQHDLSIASITIIVRPIREVVRTELQLFLRFEERVNHLPVLGLIGERLYSS